jgi:hypothetical protein
MFKTFNQFLKNEYEARCNSAMVRAAYQQAGGFKTFKKNYITGHHFSEYLETLSGTTLTALQTYHVAKSLVNDGGRKIAELPAILSQSCRYYDIELPAVYGIMTVDYWQERFGQKEVALS